MKYAIPYVMFVLIVISIYPLITDNDKKVIYTEHEGTICEGETCTTYLLEHMGDREIVMLDNDKKLACEAYIKNVMSNRTFEPTMPANCFCDYMNTEGCEYKFRLK